MDPTCPVNDQIGQRIKAIFCSIDYVQSFGLQNSKLDPYVYYTKEIDLIVAIYVDDLMILWINAAVRDNLKDRLNQKFHMKDMGRTKKIVGINIRDKKDGLSIGQSTYAKQVLARFGME